jgi:Putative peptidoglycan binding domain/Protein of unknown function (DUF1236)
MAWGEHAKRNQKRNHMKKHILMSTVALVAGLAVASAQQMPGGQGGAEQKQERGAQSGAQKEQSRGNEAGRSKGEAQGKQQGQQQGKQSEQGKSGESKGGTTGQAQREQGKQAEPQQKGKQGQQGKSAEQGKAQQGKQGSEPKSGTTGQADREQGKQAEPQQKGKQGQQGKAAEQGKAQQGKQGAEPKSSTTGQGQREQGKQAEPKTDQQGRQGQQQGQTGQQGRQGDTAQQGRDQQGSVQLTTEQRTQVREQVFARSNVPRVDNVNFSVRVGTTVPTSVRIVEVPDVLIRIHPEWRAHRYFVVRDDVVIVDTSHRIVAVVPVGSSGAQLGRGDGSVGTRSGGAAMSLSVEEIREVQQVLIREGFDVEIDGRLGPKTRQALISFQGKNGLQATGQIDTQTVTKLGVNVRGSGQSTTGQGGGQQGGNMPSRDQGQQGRQDQPKGGDRNEQRSDQERRDGNAPSTTGQGGQQGGERGGNMPKGQDNNMQKGKQDSGQKGMPNRDREK